MHRVMESLVKRSKGKQHRKKLSVLLDLFTEFSRENRFRDHPAVWFPRLSHGNATLLDQIGAPMAVRLNRLGHTEAQTTMGYTHAVTADERRIADELGRILHVNARNEQEQRPAENALTLRIQ